MHLADAAEFNIRGKKTKYYTQKEIDEMASKRMRILEKQELLRKEKQKLAQAGLEPRSTPNMGPGVKK